MSDALIVFTPSGKRGRFALGTPVLQAARALGVDIDSVCGGRAICGRCQVNVGEGEFAKHGIISMASHLSEFSKVEERYERLRGLASGRRLSCQTMLLGDVVIDVPPESQVHKQVVRKEADTRIIELDPVTHDVKINGAPTQLRPLEYKLLQLLVSDPGRVFSREELLEQVWEMRGDINTRTVDVHVRRLRVSLGPAADVIETVHGFGYRAKRDGG